MGERPGELWGEALELTVDYVFNGTEPPDEKLKEIGRKMGGCTHDTKDLNALLRIAKKAKDGQPTEG